MISSDYSNYYNQLNSSIPISKQNINSKDSSTPKDSVDTISSATKKVQPFQESGNIQDLELSARKMMHTMNMQNTDTSEDSESMSKIKTDMNAIKTSDINNMSADDLKTTLSNVITDMQSMPKPQGDSNKTSEINLDSMSESDMRDMLKNIQERAINSPGTKQESNLDNAFSKVTSDMDSIKAADITTLSTDDVKTTLSNLITDMNAIRKSNVGYTNSTQVSLDNISESDMRKMLQKIQDSANKVSSQNGTSESTDLFTNLNSDIANIKTVDIDTMSTDKMKESLMNLITDMKSISSKTQASDSESDQTFGIDVNNLTESEMRDILKKIQEDASNKQMMNGLNSPTILNSIFSSENYSSQLNSSNNVQSDELIEA